VRCAGHLISRPNRRFQFHKRGQLFIRSRKDHRGVDLISDMLPLGRLWYAGPTAVVNAIGYAEHRSRSHHAVIRVYDEAGNVIATHEYNGDFKE
jgi:hypothetical protein